MKRKYTLDNDGNRRCGNCNSIQVQQKSGYWDCTLCHNARERRRKERVTGKPCLPKRQQKYRLSETGEVAYLELTRGQEALIDATDLPLVMNHRWSAKRARKVFYAATTINGKFVYLHHVICGKWADHENRNPLDNRRNNLRLSTRLQQAANHSNRRNISGVRGVRFLQSTNKWQARIHKNKICHYLGCFDTLETASHVYKMAAVGLFGRFAPIEIRDYVCSYLQGLVNE